MLRPYQEAAFEAIKRDMKNEGPSIVVMPTASGKSHVIAHAASLGDPVLILQPTRELLAQNREKMGLIVPAEDIGTYSASFNERTIKKFTFATIQSVYKKPEDFQHIKLVIIDECHGLAPRELSSMYTSFLAAIGSPKTIGFTATPYRLEKSYFRRENGDLEQATMLKLINRMRNKKMNKNFWRRIIYKIDHQHLVDRGYLSPIEYIDTPLMSYREIPVNVSRSDYNLEKYTEAIVGKQAIIMETIAEAQKRYKAVLVFCSTTEQALELSQALVGSAVVLAGTPAKERNAIIKGFKDGSIKTVFNVGTLTTGFDKPDLDCVILLRPTRSILLYNQMVGRLTRIAPGKAQGTLIDLSGTSGLLGTVESFQVYQNEFHQWDLKTSRFDNWHNKCLFIQQIQR